MGRADGSAAPLQSALNRLCAMLAPRAGSLAITIFGDSIALQGQSVWLGGLVTVMQQFGLNARQIRTAVFRLGREGWLVPSLSGRRSYYSFTASGERQYARAAERIYAANAVRWDGNWTLISAVGLKPDTRDELRRRLGWLGFGALGSGVFAHPQAAAATVQDVLRELACAEQVVVWRATAGVDAALAALVRTSWRLDELAQRFDAFIARFEGFYRLLDSVVEIEPRDAFVLRTLLIHEYRRILLKSTELPGALLPTTWPGHAARDLTTGLYRRLQAPATHYCCSALENSQGLLPAPAAGFAQRFAARA